ncbi:hypothetical protein Q3G72_011187 [Acer saccharum]|nr:hypothetical protein Q3G72_011187 [Acer saccharum]
MSKEKAQNPVTVICQVLFIFLFLAGVIVLTLWLVYRPYKPRFTVVGAAVYDLNVSSPPFLTTSMQFTIVTRNPNKRVAIIYDKLSAYVSYKNQQITPPVYLPPLFHETKSTVAMSPVLGGGPVPVSVEVVNGLVMDETYGVVALRVVLLGRLRWKTGAIKTARYGVYVKCDVWVGLKKGFVGQVPLVGSQPSGEESSVRSRSPKTKMEGQNSQHGQIIEINVDVPGREGNLTGSKICGEAPCGFSDAGTNSKDAKERSDSIRKLLIAVALCVVFMSMEVVGGIKANSLSILTDAAHLLSDVAAFAISLFSLWAAGWESTPRQTYGFFRIEILGALVSIQLIWLLAGILVYEAIVRLINDTGEVDGFLMFLVATFGLVVNIIMALVLGHDHGHGHGHGHGHDDHGHGIGHSHGKRISSDRHHHAEISEGEHTHHDEEIPKAEDHHHGVEHSQDKHDHHHHHGVEHSHDEQHHSDTEPLLDKPKDGNEQKKRRNINVQGAYLHVLGDSIQSIGVMIGGAVIWYKPEWKIVDVICTLIFSVIVLGTTIRMLRNILEVLMESTPREIDATKLEKGLLEMEEVVHIHELHIWAITVGKVLLACHVKIRPEANADMVLDNVVNYIRREYNISHVTVQIER